MSIFHLHNFCNQICPYCLGSIHFDNMCIQLHYLYCIFLFDIHYSLLYPECFGTCPRCRSCTRFCPLRTGTAPCCMVGTTIVPSGCYTCPRRTSSRSDRPGSSNPRGIQNRCCLLILNSIHLDNTDRELRAYRRGHTFLRHMHCTIAPPPLSGMFHSRQSNFQIIHTAKLCVDWIRNHHSSIP